MIVVPYDMLLCLEPSPAPRLQRSIAPQNAASPTAALAQLVDLPDAQDGYHPYDATRAEVLRALSQPFESWLADERALRLTDNPAEQQLLWQRRGWGRPGEVCEYVAAS